MLIQLNVLDGQLMLTKHSGEQSLTSMLGETNNIKVTFKQDNLLVGGAYLIYQSAPHHHVHQKEPKPGDLRNT